PGDLQDNLCLKAYRLLAADFTLPPVSMHLHKHIPIGAGLGGGSSDAVAVLEILNKLFDLRLDRHEIKAYALRLGADCAFFVINKPCFATGIGEKLAPVSLQLQGYYLVVLKPPYHISTAEAFASIRP